MSDEEEDRPLNPLAFLEHYLQEEAEKAQLTQKREQFAQMMGTVAAKKPVKKVYAPTHRASAPEDMPRPAAEPQDYAGRYFQELADRYAQALAETREQLGEIHQILFVALDGANGGVPDGATVVEMAEAARQTLVAYRITATGYRKRLLEQQELLKKLTERADEARDSFVTLHDGTTLRVHLPSDCNDPDRCSIHNPSDHPLRNAPYHWERGRMHRLCEHGFIHPDPDDLHYRKQLEEYGGPVDNDIDAHEEDCDGCCF